MGWRGLERIPSKRERKVSRRELDPLVLAQARRGEVSKRHFRCIRVSKGELYLLLPA